MANKREMDSSCYRPERLGIVYCSTSFTPPGRENEKLSDGEIVESALEIKGVLAESGYSVEIVDLGKDSISSLRKFDWIFNLAETIAGFPLADYEVTGMMEAMGLGFTGSSSTTLKDCLDKATAKSIMQQNGITTPAYEVIHPGCKAITSLDFPLIVKPIHEDGGVGIFDDSIVSSPEELAQGVARIHKIFRQAALVEEFIDGRDLKVSILGNGEEIEVMPISECIYLDPAKTKILTFDANWVQSTRAYQTVYTRCPCEIDETTAQYLASTAIDVYSLMNCRDYARIDFRVKEKTPYVLEVNPNPCINPSGSGFVTACKSVGLSYADIINRILQSSLINSQVTPIPEFIEENL